MAGLYIHIPFCKSRCIYCGFYSTTALELRQRYVDAVCKEITAHPLPLPKGEEIDTVYLGGGTPSQLSIAQLEQILAPLIPPKGSHGDGSDDPIFEENGITQNRPHDPEVTMECNPDDVTVAYAAALPKLGINRVSMGAQTFDDERLRFLNRRHTAAQVPQAVQRLRDAGITNISIDLMYGFPDETLTDWERDIDAALALGVEHISSYCLMYEEGTPLYERLKRKDEKVTMLDEETERQMYELLTEKLEAAGYEHYELSNWSRSHRSRHNSNYWKDVPYIGIGAASHSYDGHRRWWNVANLQEYIRRMENGESPVEDSEPIEGWTRYNDRVTVALRTCEGLDLTTLTEEQRDYCMKNARRFMDDGLLQEKAHHLVLTRKGLFVSDMVMSELMKV